MLDFMACEFSLDNNKKEIGERLDTVDEKLL